MNRQPTQEEMERMLEKSTPVTCSCGHDTFDECVTIRKLSRLITMAPTDQMVPLSVFVCRSCGAKFDPKRSIEQSNNQQPSLLTPPQQ